MNDSVVYIHRKKTNNEIFYVGIGSIHRPYSKHRSQFWHNTVNKHGYNVEILYSDISYEDAKELEVLLIETIGRKELGKGTLVNMTDGGEGSRGHIKSEEAIQKHKLKMIGRKQTPEHIEAAAAPKRGRKNSPEHIESSASKMRKPVIQCNLDGELMNEFISAQEAAKSIGVKDSSNITACCRGRYTKVYGSIWKYK